MTCHAPQPAPLHPWEWPDHPCICLHIDYAGPYLKKWFLVVVDAHSKWLEVKFVNNATTINMIKHLRSLFATHGLPEMIVSDNGSVFTSIEFQDFCTKNGIKHVKSAPYHPASNGLAERTVQMYKEAKPSRSLINLGVQISIQLPSNTSFNNWGFPAELLLG